MLIKDINMGLLDFPALKDGRKFICAGNMGKEKLPFGMRLKRGLQADSR